MIKKIWLRNYGPFDDAELTLQPLTVIVGPNASGKSIALKALHRLREISEIGRALGLMRKKGSEPGDLGLGFETRSGHRVEALIQPNGSGNFKGGFSNAPKTVLLHLQPERLRQASYLPPEVLELREDGYGLATVLADMKLSDSEGFTLIMDQTRAIVPTFENLRIRRAKVEGGDRQGVSGNELIFDMKSAPDLPPTAVSDGTLFALGLLTILTGYSKQEGKVEEPLLVLIDELERSFHPKALGELITQLRRLAETSNVQILATSHSPYLVDCLQPEEVRITSLLLDGSATIRELGDHPEFERWKEEMTPGEFWSTVGEDWS